MMILVNGFIIASYALFVSIYDMAFPPDKRQLEIAYDPEEIEYDRPGDDQKEGSKKDNDDKPEDEKPLVENEEGKEGEGEENKE